MFSITHYEWGRLISMNKTEMKNIIEDTLGNSLTIEQAATLEYIGKLAKEIAWEKSGVYRNAEERANNLCL